MASMSTLNEGPSTENAESPSRYVARIAQQSGSSFYSAMRVLDPERRSAMYAIYAFCRVVDDIADGEGNPAGKVRSLEAWRQEISLVYQKDGQTLLGQALQDVVMRYGVDKGNFMAVIDGMESDAHDHVRIADEAALFDYIDQVACAVGRLCTPIFGLPDHLGIPLARVLGEALQITNILRDLEEDAARDRLYLPLNQLKLLGLDGDSAADVFLDPVCAGVLGNLAAQAFSRFDEAGNMLCGMDKTARRAPLLMMAAYRRLLHKITSSGWVFPRRRAVLPLWEKAWIVLRYGCF